MASPTFGREAAIARRLALSAGKAALPPATERTRTGFRSAGGGGSPAPAPAALPAVASPALLSLAGPSMSGRLASLERRLALSAGKSGLMASASTQAPAALPVAAAPAPRVAASPSTSGRMASLERRQALSAGKGGLVAATTTPAPAAPASAPLQAVSCPEGSCRDQARARRAAMATKGRGATTPAVPAQRGKIEYAPKVVESATQHGLHVTGSRIGRGDKVTGDERGTVMPVSGTQYIDAENGGAWRASGTKVGQSRTEGGLTVSGTLVRSAVRITGDERGESAKITGKVDPRAKDDLTARPESGAAVSAQFQRQADPHGSTVFGTNLGRSARGVGSRQRQREAVIEATEGGATITGSAIGRSGRVTGDETGACRPITGSQYLAPAKRETACGGTGGGTAAATQIGAARPDPVSAGKVAVSQTWGGQRVTGMDVEHDSRVTGDAPGSCATLTGSQYQGPNTAVGFCSSDAAKSATARRMLARASKPVTGDTPLNNQAVSGLARGAARDITGTPYYRSEPDSVQPADPVTAIDQSFSIRSPQRSAQLRTDRPANDEAGRITGSFAVGGGKVTGNFEFVGKSRSAANKDRPPAHARISGEGSTKGHAITGNSYGDTSRVTGNDGAFAAERNPTERGEKGKAFAGANVFKSQAKKEEPKQLVTGMFGYFSKTGARVTLSGGAQS